MRLNFERPATINKLQGSLVLLSIPASGLTVDMVAGRGRGDITVSKGGTGIYVVSLIADTLQDLFVVGSMPATAGLIASYSAVGVRAITITWATSAATATDTAFELCLFGSDNKFG